MMHKRHKGKVDKRNRQMDSKNVHKGGKKRQPPQKTGTADENERENMLCNKIK